MELDLVKNILNNGLQGVTYIVYPFATCENDAHNFGSVAISKSKFDVLLKKCTLRYDKPKINIGTLIRYREMEMFVHNDTRFTILKRSINAHVKNNVLICEYLVKSISSNSIPNISVYHDEKEIEEFVFALDENTNICFTNENNKYYTVCVEIIKVSGLTFNLLNKVEMTLFS